MVHSIFYFRDVYKTITIKGVESVETELDEAGKPLWLVGIKKREIVDFSGTG